MKKVLLLFLFLLVSTSVWASPTVGTPPKVNSQYFIENKGQWDKEALYLARLGGIDYWITQNGSVVDNYYIKRPTDINITDPQHNEQDYVEKSIRIGHIIRNSFLNANPNSVASPENQLEGYYNYLIGNDKSKWASNVHLFSNLRIKNLYEGIDIIYKFNENNIRYDFELAPNADPSQIKIKFTGQDNIQITPDGNLQLTTTLGEIQQTKLYVFQDNGTSQNKIECKFKIEGDGVVGFDIGNYDHSKPVIIDPTYVFGSFLGGSSTDYAYATTIDPSDNPVVAGYTYSSNFPKTVGAYQQYLSSTPDGFVTKFNSTGSSLIFSTYFGGNSSDYIYGCRTDANGYVYVAGYTYSSNMPTTAGAFQPYASSTPDGFVTKFNSTGTGLLYCTYLGGNSTDQIYALDVDANGYAYVTGYTYSSNFPTTAGAFRTTLISGPDLFVTKLNTSGTGLVFSTYLGGSSGDYGYGIAADQYGCAYVTGYTYSSNFPTTAGAFKTTYSYYDPFITKVASDGKSLVYSTYIPGSSSDYAYAICVDNNGQAAITGYTYSWDFPKVNAFQTSLYSPDAFVLKMNATGTYPIFSTYFGGSSSDYGYGIASDAAGNTYVSGYTYSSNFYTTSDGFQRYSTGFPDAFVAKFDATGVPTYSTYLGGSSTDQAYYFQSCDINQNNKFAVGGYTYSTNFPYTANAFQKIIYSAPECWVSEFAFEPPNKITTTSAMPYQFCAGDALTVTFTSEGNYKPGNYFKAQISDENGSFASPIEIGSIQSSITGNGTINCILPGSMKPKSGYRVRVVSTSPTAIGSDNGTNLEVMQPPASFKLVGDGGYCENDKFGAEVKIESSEKYAMYQLYRDGVRVGASIAGTGFPLSFGRYKAEGAYTVVGTSPFGCNAPMNGTINIRQIPTPVAYAVTGGGQFYNQSGPGTYCEGSNGVAIGLAQGDLGVVYQLQRDGKDVDIPIPGLGGDISFGYHTEQGVYTIKGISIIAGCTNTMSGSIAVQMLPAPNAYDVISDGVFCEADLKGSEVKLSNSDIGCNYQLFFNGAAIGKPVNGIGSSISFGSFKQSGVYNVVATNLSTGCTSNMNGTITFKTVPQPKTFNLTGSEKYCEDADGTDLALDGSETNVIYTLYFNNQPASQGILGDGNPIDFGKFKNAGTYTCQAASIDGHCTIAMDGSIQVTPVALPDVTIQGNTTPKMLFSETYSVTNPEEGEIYLWNVKNGTIDGVNNKATVSINWLDKKKGEISLTRTNKYNCTNQGTLAINLVNDIVADFDAQQKSGDAPFLVQFENKTTGIVSYYNWDFGDGLYAFTENPGHTYKAPGTYSVTLTVSHEGDKKTRSKSDLIKVFPANSVNENTISNDANSYGFSLIEPNPANNHIRFDYFVKSNQTIEIAVFDSKGTEVLVAYKGLALIGNNSLTVDISKLSSGSYYLEMIGNEGTVNQHFTVVR